MTALAYSASTGKGNQRAKNTGLIDPALFDADESLAPAEVVEAAAMGSLADFCTGALAACEEAVAACQEFSDLLEFRGEYAAAQLFAKIAAAERIRAAELSARRAEHCTHVPAFQYNWLFHANPDDETRELVRQMLTPHAVLKIALRAQSRVAAFYECLADSARDPAVRALADDLAIEKAQQLALLKEALIATPEVFAWDESLLGLLPCS